MSTMTIYTFAPYICVVCAYLLGSVPFGLLLARSRGVNIREVGSGNIGATNVFRAVGKGLGITAFVCDFIKGLLPVVLFPLLLQKLTGAEPSLAFQLICGCVAVAGHNWPIFLKFKGGKGVATSAGMLAGIAPAVVGIGLLFWILTFLTTRYVSVASLCAAVVIAVSGWILYYDGNVLRPAILSLLALLIIIRHRTNIGRIIKGTENRFEFKKKQKENEYE